MKSPSNITQTAIVVTNRGHSLDRRGIALDNPSSPGHDGSGEMVTIRRSWMPCDGQDDDTNPAP
jgi:hypothetical protein